MSAYKPPSQKIILIRKKNVDRLINDFTLCKKKYYQLLYMEARKIQYIPGVDIEDLMQEGFIKLFTALPKYDPKQSKIKTYIINVIRRHFRRLLKRATNGKNAPRAYFIWDGGKDLGGRYIEKGPPIHPISTEIPSPDDPEKNYEIGGYNSDSRLSFRLDKGVILSDNADIPTPEDIVYYMEIMQLVKKELTKFEEKVFDCIFNPNEALIKITSKKMKKRILFERGDIELYEEAISEHLGLNNTFKVRNARAKIKNIVTNIVHGS